MSAQTPTRASPLSALLVEHTSKITHTDGSKHMHPIPKARLLTSSDVGRKGDEKKKALAEKEQRRKEREQKKRLKEE